MTDPVGAIEVAARLGVQRTTVHKWLELRRMPPADFESVNGSRAWEWDTILRWAGEKGKLRTGELQALYR